MGAKARPAAHGIHRHRGKGPAGAQSRPAARPPLRSIAAAALILALTLMPLPEGDGPGLFPGADKLVHFSMFALFGLAARADAAARGRLRAGAAAAFGLALAVGTELAQAFIPGRGADLADFAADALGLAFGLLAGRVLVLRPRPRSPDGPEQVRLY